MRHFKEHFYHIYNRPEKKVLDLKGYTEKVKNVHFQENLELIKKK